MTLRTERPPEPQSESSTEAAAQVRRIAELYASRYGDTTGSATLDDNEVIASIMRHRTVRRFRDAAVTDRQLAAIIAAAQSASTSSNQQSWSVVAVTNADRRRTLSELSNHQTSIVSAPLALVWVADWSRSRAIAARFGYGAELTEQFEGTLCAVIDTALAAQAAAIAAEATGLGVAFVGAVRDHPVEVAEMLGLPEGAVPLMAMAVGWPDPAEKAGIKPRLPQHVVLHRERYREADPAEIEQYDRTVREYYARWGTDSAWIDRHLHRLDSGGGPRSEMRLLFERLGLPSR